MTNEQRLKVFTERVLAKLDRDTGLSAGQVAFRIGGDTVYTRSVLADLARQGRVHRTFPPNGTKKPSTYRAI
jgi:hypothetical protein